MPVAPDLEYVSQSIKEQQKANYNQLWIYDYQKKVIGEEVIASDGSTLCQILATIIRPTMSNQDNIV